MQRYVVSLAAVVLLSLPTAALAGRTRAPRVAARLKVPPRTVPIAPGMRGAMQRLFGTSRESHETRGPGGYDHVTTTQRDRYRWDAGARALTLRTTKVWSIGTRSHDPMLGVCCLAQDFWWSKSKTVYGDGKKPELTTGSYRERGVGFLGRFGRHRYRLGDER